MTTEERVTDLERRADRIEELTIQMADLLIVLPSWWGIDWIDGLVGLKEMGINVESDKEL